MDIVANAEKGLRDLWRDSQDIYINKKLPLFLWFLISFALGGIPLWINYVWGMQLSPSFWTNIDNGRVLFFCITSLSSAATSILQYKGDQYRSVVNILHVIFLLVIILASYKVANSNLPVEAELFQIRLVSVIILLISFIALFFLQIIKMSDASAFLEEKLTSETRFAKES